jgi:RNA polymerase sigma-70 factor, ECF subfamily
MEEAALIAKACRGDGGALALLLREHYLPVKKYLITVTFDRALAEDLTQETMIRAIKRIGQYEGRSRFSTWLMAIATHLYLDVLRRRKREGEVQAAVSTVLLTDRPAGAATDPAWEDLIIRLQQLPRDVALPVVLKHYYGYTYEEIAGWMDLPAGTVKSRIHNGIRALRKELIVDGQ